jgi:Na+-translocating ferredoxin:NAD+ oxidoreductase RnfG subunit
MRKVLKISNLLLLILSISFMIVACTDSDTQSDTSDPVDSSDPIDSEPPIDTVIEPTDLYATWFGAGYTMVFDPEFTPSGFVLEKNIVSNAEGQVIGSFYKVRGVATYNDSGSSGSITLYVGILTDDTIVGIDMPREEYGHTTTAIFLNKVQAYVDSIVGSHITSFAGQVDLVAGASYSQAHVDRLLDDVALAHTPTVEYPEAPYDSWFGAGYTKVSDPGFTPVGFVLEKDIIRNAKGQVIGSFYKVRGVSVYNNGGSTGAISLYVGILTNGTIVGIEMPVAEYGHTTGTRFLPRVQDYVASIVGSNIKSFSGQSDLAAGASYSRAHVDALLDAIGAIFES